MGNLLHSVYLIEVIFPIKNSLLEFFIDVSGTPPARTYFSLVSFNMITKDDIFKLQTRRKIYDFINKYPGLHLREISRRSNIPLGSLRYYIKSLDKYGLIVIKTDHKFKRYYVNQTVGEKDKELLNILRQDIPLRVILMLLTPGIVTEWGDFFEKNTEVCTCSFIGFVDTTRTIKSFPS